MSTKIRGLQPQDRTKLITLFTEFGHYLEKLDQVALKLLIVPKNYGEFFYQKMIGDVEKKQGKVWVVEVEEEIVGFIAGVVIEVGDSLDEIDCKAHLMGRVIELFINEKYRNQGLGKKLMEEMIDYFKVKGCYKVNIEVFGPNQNAYHFYKKLGFQDRSYDLTKVLQ